MESSHSQTIQNLLPFLAKKTSDLPRLLTHLLSISVVSETEKQQIEGFRTDHEKNIELYWIIKRKPPAVYKQFCKALSETGNSHVVHKLEAEENIIAENDIHSRVIKKEMSRLDRKRIVRNWKYLTGRTCNLIELLTYLEGAGVITTDESETTRKIPCNNHQCEFLYATLLQKDSDTLQHLRKAFSETNNSHLINILCAEISDFDEYSDGEEVLEEFETFYINKRSLKIVKKMYPVRFDLRGPTVNFTGRENVLERLHKSIRSQDIARKDESNPVSQITVLCGVGGVGKSYTARKYAYKYHSDSNVIWINAETYESMYDSFRRLAKNKLNIKLKNENGEVRDIKTIVEEVYDQFADKKSIFIFDNAEHWIDDWNTEIDQFLPSMTPSTRRPDVLITSQSKHWNSPDQCWDIVELDPFSKTESLDFIKTSLLCVQEVPEADIVNLSNKIQGLPLDLQLAVGYINKSYKELNNLNAKYYVKEYLEEYENNYLKLMEHPYFQTIQKNTQITMNIYQISVERMKSENDGPLALQILNIMAYFNSENISAVMFKRLFNDERKLGSTFELLKRYSLVGLREGKLSMHGVIQHVTRVGLQHNNVNKYQHNEHNTLQKALNLLNSTVPEESYKILDDKIQFSHAMTTWNSAIAYSDLVENYHIHLGLTTMHLLSCGSYKNVQKLTSDGALHLEKQVGEKNEATVKIKFINMLSLILLGNYNEAMQKAKFCFDALSSNFPTELSRQNKSKLSIIAKNILEEPMCLQDSNSQLVERFKEEFLKMNVNLSQADPLSETGNLSSDSASDPFDPNFLIKLVSAGILDKEGRYDEALYNLEQVHEAFKNSFGENNEWTQNLEKVGAGILSKQGRVQEALKIFEEINATNALLNKPAPSTWSSYELTVENPITLLTRSIEADVLRDTGKYQEALNIFQDIAEQQIQRLGPYHAETLSTQAEIGLTLIKKEEYQTALNILLTPHDNSVKYLGFNDQVTMKLKTTMIMAFRKLNRYEEALDFAQQLYDYFCSILGDENETTCSFAVTIAGLIEERDNASATNSDAALPASMK